MVIDLKVRTQVDRMFDQIDGRGGETVRNPVTGSRWVKGLDSAEAQREAAYRALMAQRWFASVAPEDAPFLPLSDEECNRLKAGGISAIVAWFAQSLTRLDYDFESHPSFDDYARGVMASPLAPDYIKNDQHLRSRYPARALAGLGSGLVWRATAHHRPAAAVP